VHKLIIPTSILAMTVGTAPSYGQSGAAAKEPLKVDYVEEWDDPAELRPQLSCERFSRLLELVEMAAEAPEVEFRWISETYGMDYIATQRAVQAGGDVEPGDH
jgi:hypothetical protein